MRYQTIGAGESTTLLGELSTGDSPEITIYNLATRTAIALTQSGCDELESTGWYCYDSSGIVTAATEKTEYLYLMSGDAGTYPGKFVVGGYPDTINTLATSGVVGQILEDTGTTIPALISVVDGVVDTILVDTNALNDTKIPDTISLANINAEVDTALTDIHLDHLIAAAHGDTPVTGSIIASMVGNNGVWAGFSTKTDSLEMIAEDTQNIKTRLPAALTIAGKMNSDATAISGDSTAAANLEATYDGTGYADSYAPAQQQQLENIANTGAAINTVADSFTLTSGTVIAGTYEDTVTLDGTYHQIEDESGDIEAYYEFDVGVDGVPTSVTFVGRANGNNDDINIKAYHWDDTDWDQCGVMYGTSLSSDDTHTYTLFTRHVGTGANVGKVRVQVQATSLVSADLYIDQLFLSYAVVNRSVGYADGAIWVDTNNGTAGTTAFIHGTADKPCLTWPDALTLNATLGFNRFHVASQSFVLLTANSDGYYIDAAEATIDLGGQSIAGAYIFGALISGVATGDNARFIDCKIGELTVPPCGMGRCGFGYNSATFTAASAGQFVFVECFSMVPGSGTPNFNFSGLGSTTGINNRAYTGGSAWILDDDCTISNEPLAGGGQTFTTNGANVELRGIFRSATYHVDGAAGTIQQVGVTGPITIDGTGTTTINLYGVSASVTDTSIGTTVNDETVNNTLIAASGEYTAALTTIQADLDNPDQYKADVSALAASGVVGQILEDTGTTLPASLSDIETDTQDIQNSQISISGMVDAIDISSLESDVTAILEDTGTTLPASLVAIQADLDNPDQYKADVSALAEEASISGIIVYEHETTKTYLSGVTANEGGGSAPTAGEVADAVWVDPEAVIVISGVVYSGIDNANLAPASEYDSELTAIQADLDNPGQYKADITALATSGVVGLIQEDTEYIQTVVDNIETDTQDLQSTLSTPDSFKADVTALATSGVVGQILEDTIDIQSTVNDIESDIITVQADLDNPDQYKADVTALATSGILGQVQEDTEDIQSTLSTPNNFKADVSALALEANISGYVADAINVYDPPTRTEATSDKDEIITDISELETSLSGVITIDNGSLETTLSGIMVTNTSGIEGMVIDLRDEALGKWVLDTGAGTLTYYRMDGVTVLKTFTLTGDVTLYTGRTPQ